MAGRKGKVPRDVDKVPERGFSAAERVILLRAGSADLAPARGALAPPTATVGTLIIRRKRAAALSRSTRFARIVMTPSRYGTA